MSGPCKNGAVFRGLVRLAYSAKWPGLDDRHGQSAGNSGTHYLAHEPHHYTMFYVEVDDVQAYLDKAAALGGKTLVPPIKIPTGTFAWLSDLDGNTIGLLKPEP
jgi:predicted enzyme related to lactoylglutathione lyase